MESERASLNPPKDDAKKPKDDKVMTVGYFALFKYATSSEKLILALAILMSCGHGAMMPVFSIIFGNVTSDFTADKTADQRRKQASETALKMFYVGLGTLAAAFLASFFWNYIGQKINLRVRKLYFHAMAGQEMGWFDEMNPETMTTRYVENMHKFSGAIGQKNHVFIYATAMTFSGFIIGFVSGWWYALIVTLSFPIIMIGMIGFVTIMAKESQVTKESYEKAGGNAEQAFRAIKTVKILSGEEHELNIYKNAVEHAKSESMKFGMLAGLSFGFFFAAVFVAYGLNYWLGSVLVDKNIYNHNKKRDYNVADVVTIFFAVIMGGFAIGNTSPAAKAIGMGRVAAYEIYQILDRVSKIPLDDPNGIKPDSIDGDIEFKNIHFKYPTRKETPVLQGLNLVIPKGKKVALVGETGCGKSTTIQLLERYYDPDSGTVTIDGKDIKSYNLIALRKFIGYVGQEPVLFAGSIRENLLLAKPTATEDQMIEALKQANAYSFVVKLEKGIDSYVGAGGSQLSGGQKQRIAIARSILQNPRILLLDEATSALDRRNEKEIQQTLDYFARERTTVTIAHRLSTVMNSDIIYVLEKGQVIEAGNHHDLVAKNGFYAKLVSHQLVGTALDEPGMSRKTSVDPAQIHLNKHISAEPEPEDPQKENGDDKEEVKKSDELTFEEKIALKQEEKKKAKESKKRLNRYLEGNYFLMIIGCIFSLASGALMPIFALLMADMIEVLSKFDVYRNYYHYDNNSPQWQDLKKEALYIGGYYLIMAGVSLITNFFQIGTFHVMGQRITTRLRTELYEHFLTRDMEFFDDPQNSPGDLSTVLAKDCLTVNTIVSTSYGAILNALGSFACGITISMIASWRLCLVALSVSPMIVVAGVIESKLMQPPEIEKTETRESKTFQEVCTNMRTVNSLNAQPFLYERFYTYVVAENDSKTSSSIIRGIVYGLGQFAMFAVYALTFYAGAEFTVKYDLQFRDLFRSLFAIIFAAFGAGMGQQFAGNIGEAETASKKIFDYLDIKNKITYSAQPYTGDVKGRIELRNVKFTYPQRKQACFKDLSLTIEPKQKVAFAGPSGTGKSTIFSLLYRFYDVDSGEILLDGVNIKDYDIKHLRSSLGTVSQEPVLFNNSIRYNIKYNQPLRTDDEMIEAATIANAMKFIGGDERIENQSPVLQVSPHPSGDQSPEKQKLKQDEEDGYGFDRNVGERGSKLSGGQKQRVAIARTVIRRPHIYMFDESTSALDTQSEKIVQDALNKISEQNTSLAIAHRIATIKDSDVIFVIEGGKVVEQGTYKQLIDMKGAFYQLNKNH